MYWKRRNILAFGLVSVSYTFCTFSISGIACHGVWRRGLHRCVRIEKLLSLDLNFARFGVRKSPKNHSNRSPFIKSVLTQVGNFCILKPCSLEPTARAVHPIRSSGFFCISQILPSVTILFATQLKCFKTRFLAICSPKTELSLSLYLLLLPQNFLAKPQNFETLATKSLNLAIYT